MPFRAACAAAILTALPLGAGAGPVEEIYAALRLDEVIAVMRQEGIAYGTEIEADLFPGQGGAVWDEIVARIYDETRMTERVAEELEEALDGAETAAMLDFVGSETGQKIVALEIEARRTLRDDAAEAAARAAARDLPTARRDRIERFIDANDLIEQNVAGAMNANLAFFRGLADGGALLPGLTEDEILADVWAQEPEIREDTTGWLHAYLALAYQPLAAGTLDEYIAFSRSEGGQALNAAIFVAFDGLYEDISRELGAGAAGFMQGQDI